MKRALLALLAACVPVTPANLPLDDARALAALEQAWSAAGLRSLAGCLIADSRVVHTSTDDQFAGLCGAPSSEVASCGAQVTVGTAGVPEVVLRPGQASLDSTGGPVVHELIHLARACAYGDGDPGHTDARLWLAANPTPAGRAACVQGRAKAALGYAAQ